MEFNAELTAAGLSLFHNFFRVAGAVALTAILPALAMRADPEEPQASWSRKG